MAVTKLQAGTLTQDDAGNYYSSDGKGNESLIPKGALSQDDTGSYYVDDSINDTSDEIDGESAWDVTFKYLDKPAGFVRGGMQGIIDGGINPFDVDSAVPSAIKGAWNNEDNRWGEWMFGKLDNAIQNPDDHPVLSAIGSNAKAVGAIAGVGGTVLDFVTDPIGVILGGAAGAGMKLAKGKRASKVAAKIESEFNKNLASGITKPTVAYRKALQDTGFGKEAFEEIAKSNGIKLPKFSYQRTADPTKIIQKNKLIKLPEKLDVATQKLAEGGKFAAGLLDSALRPLHMAVSDINPRIGAHLKHTEIKWLLNTGDDSRSIKPWAEMYKELGKVSRKSEGLNAQVFRLEPFKSSTKGATTLQQSLDRSLADGDFKTAKSIMNNVKGMSDEFDNSIVPLLQKKGSQLEGVTLEKEFALLENYFPKAVKDSKLLDAILKKIPVGKSNMQRKLSEAMHVEGKRLGRSLTEVERASVLNKVMTNPKIESAINKIGAEKKRVLEKMTEDVQPAYYNSVDALHRYVNSVNHASMRREFLGKSGVKLDDASKEDFIENSVGGIISKEYTDGMINSDQSEKLYDLVMSRFVGGEKAMPTAFNVFKAGTYGALLGNPMSALIQGGDGFVPSFMHGISATTKGAVASGVDKLTKGKVKGGTLKWRVLQGDIAADMSNMGGASNLLDWWMAKPFVGFKNADFAMKDVQLNSSIAKMKALSKTKKGIGKLKDKYFDFFGRNEREFQSFVKSAKVGDHTNINVRQAVVSDLMDVQPITMSNMTPAYLNSGAAGRSMYMLQQFTIHQLNIVRNTAVAKLKRGDVVDGTADLMRYGLLVGTLGNGSVQLGRAAIYDAIDNGDRTDDWLPQEAEEVPAQFAQNMLSMFGAGKYIQQQASREGFDKAIGGFIMPPLTPILSPISAAVAGDASVLAKDLGGYPKLIHMLFENM